MKPYAEKLYKSTKWRRVSKAYMISKNYICERCGAPGEICHHRKYVTPKNVDDPNITLNPDNLECLCRECHHKEHADSYGRKQITHFGVNFDENGNIIKNPDVFIVCGCPGSGKTHYVKEHKDIGDIVIDFDYLCAALACQDGIYYDHLPVIEVALSVREHLYQIIEERKSRWKKAWVITAEPDPYIVKQLAYRLRAEIINIESTPEQCKAHIDSDPRRQNKLTFYTLVDEWYSKHKKALEAMPPA